MTTREGSGYWSNIMKEQARPPLVVECDNSETGEFFFDGYRGVQLMGMEFMRYPTHTVVALLTDDNRAMMVATEPDGLISVEMFDRTLSGGRANLAFRDDIQRSRFDLWGSIAAGEDVVYVDPNDITTGEVTTINPAVEFAQVVFAKPAIIAAIRPTRNVEDWMTVELNDGRDLVMRADLYKMHGALRVDDTGVDYLRMGGNLTDLDLRGEASALGRRLLLHER